jgi:hypothetical protein
MEPVQDEVPAREPAPPPKATVQAIPSVREHLPSAVFGAAIPLAIYFLVRGHVNGDTQALIIAGSFSVAWVIFEALRRRRIDLVGTIVLFGFAVGVLSSTLLGGNAYVLKIRDAAFTAAFGAFCIVTLFTQGRPALFYVGRYLSAGRDPVKSAAYDSLHDLPAGRHTFRVLSVVWGIGLIVEATARMIIADILPTATFLAVSPFITAGVIGSLFGFTVIYAKRAQMASLTSQVAIEGDDDSAAPS